MYCTGDQLITTVEDNVYMLTYSNDSAHLDLYTYQNYPLVSRVGKFILYNGNNII